MMNQIRQAIALPSSGNIPGAVSDEDAVRRVLSGDKAAFELLMRRYNQRLFRVVRSFIREESEAEDVVQQTYVRAYQKLSQFIGNARFATWLTKIAINEALSRQRRLRSMHVVDFSDPQNSGLEPRMVDNHPEDQACLEELGAVLTKAVDELPEQLRTVFTLRVIEEIDTEETAECLGLSEANVKVRLHRAREQLRKYIDDCIGVGVRKVYQFDGERCDRIVRSVQERLAREYGV